MSEQKQKSYLLNTLDQEQIFMTTNIAVSKSMRSAMTEVLSQNNPVGTIVGYYDNNLSILAVGKFFFANLGYSYDEFMAATQGSFSNIIISTPLYPFHPDNFINLTDFNEMYMLTKDGSPVLVRTLKQEAVDENGKRIWVLSARVDPSGRNLALINEFIQAGFWSIDYDAEGKMINVNWSNELRHMLGYQNSIEFPNTFATWADKLHPDDRALILPEVQLMSRDKYRNNYDLEYRLQLKSGKYEWFRTNVKVLRRLNGSVSHLVGVLINIENQKQALEHETNEILFKTLANTDALTNLYNDRFLRSMLNEYEEEKQKFAIFYLDLNWFKTVNDTYGHAVGDKLLQAVGQRLQNGVRTGDTVFRIGGDEFAILVPGATETQLCDALVARIKKIISRPFSIDTNEIQIDLSCGYALYPLETDNIDKVRILADHRMYKDKITNHPDGNCR